MKDEEELLLSFFTKDLPSNQWQGSLRFDRQKGSKVRVLSSLEDKKTDLKNPLDVEIYSHIISDADIVKRAVLIDLNAQERTLSYEAGILSSAVTFTCNAVAIGSKSFLKNDETLGNSFSIYSPIIFSFLNQKTYKYDVTKKGNRITVRDIKTESFKFKSKIFKVIEFNIGKSFGTSVDGDVAKINYSASVTLRPNKSMNIWEILRISQLFEKLLFLLVGSRCGPLSITVYGRRKKSQFYTISCSSPLYDRTKVVDGLSRCWTLDKVNFDFGEFFDRAIAAHEYIETSLELILEAELEEKIEAKFFRLVRALENIGRNLFPSGNERLPPEYDELLILAANNPNLTKFLEKRIKSIFSRPNSLGYTIDFVKELFPFWPVTDLDKTEIGRLRGIEAHARTHQFAPDDLHRMFYLTQILDFVCRASMIRFLGASFDDIMQGVINHSRFSWFAENYQE